MTADQGKRARISATCGALVLALTIGCSDTYVQVPIGPTTVPTTGTGGSPVPVPRTVIEFRAIGNPTSVRLRYSTPADGLAQVVTTLPYTGGFSTTAESVFLSLEGTPIGYAFLTAYPFFAVQIIVDGKVFRESTSADFFLTTLAVSGTYRR